MSSHTNFEKKIDIESEEEEILLKNGNKKKKRSFCSKFNICHLVLFGLFVVFVLSTEAVRKVVRDNPYINLKSKKNVINRKLESIPDGFVTVDINRKEGPITVDRNKDNGTKQDFYELLEKGVIKLTEEEKNTKRRVAIVTFLDDCAVNSIYENAISEMYQYSNIYGYHFRFFNLNYNKELSIFYMKLSVLLEVVVEGLKTKAFDWIFWIDSDITISNPTIRLEAFLPEDKNVHFVASADMNGLNAGVFFIRADEWAYNFLLGAITYPYYRKEKTLRFEEQTCMHNLLCERNEEDHYVIVPSHWFNRYPRSRAKGDFVIHQAGGKDKTANAKLFREQIKNTPGWFEARTNEQMRKEALDYYKLPKKSQRLSGTFKSIKVKGT